MTQHLLATDSCCSSQGKLCIHSTADPDCASGTQAASGIASDQSQVLLHFRLALILPPGLPRALLRVHDDKVVSSKALIMWGEFMLQVAWVAPISSRCPIVPLSLICLGLPTH